MKKMFSGSVCSYCLAGILLLTCTIAYAAAPPKKGKALHTYLSQYENVLGTSMELKVSTYTQVRATEAEKTALAEIKKLSEILSAYDKESEFSKWQKTCGQPVPVSNELFEVMQLFDVWRNRTGGALDASAEIVTRLWKKAASTNRVPTQQELNNAVAEIKQTHWVLNPKTRTATHLDNAPLMLNSFVKSYIIKHAVNEAMKPGDVKAVVLNIGGDIVVSGDVTENVLVKDPKADAENEAPIASLRISDKAVATSGNYRRGELIGGHWYSHIVDPRTGLPADDIISATVVAPDAADAGALATAFNVMSLPESVQLASTMPGVEYLIVTRDGKQQTSKGWGSLKAAYKENGIVGNLNTKTGNREAGGNSFEMIINLEINTQKEGFAKRPYLAVWIEDTMHSPVRTVSIWHGSDRYMPELKSWYLKYRTIYNSDMNFKSSTSSATRSAGKYTLKWDGKDDKGNYVKPGKYIVKIEAAREHGTHQLMRQEIDCDNTPKQINLPGNIEISSVSLDYHKN
ncbi:hypothetical protein A4D02_27475 [Niastella koreensis]|uniref:FAD:protein FMN transferase n=2 Tax=Niastella koreensis TaxID=354356 RepID=G8TGY1_NIAKG|nr:DUF2271 domain-containing protein [Niastella koreensis]AEV99583.1 ApbE family lipoprotein [Niastella koreensis GR20-10]OQP50174.1 hypothetical protein A4D02_27475 [Niastella koreensis]